jgi:membrane associated rhomboid family serine protease
VGPGGFRFEITRLGAVLLGAYGAVWVALALLDALRAGRGEQPLWSALALQSPGRGSPLPFRPWQLLTASLATPASGLGGLVMGALGYGFFAAPVERALGRRGFLLFWLVCLLGASLAGAAFGAFMRAPPLHWGFGPAVLALLLVHCLLAPQHTVPFLMVFPVALRWIALAVVAAVVIHTLSLTSPLGAGGPAGGYVLGGVLAGWIWFRSGGDIDPRRFLRRRRARRMVDLTVERALKGESDDDGPIWHRSPAFAATRTGRA